MMRRSPGRTRLICRFFRFCAPSLPRSLALSLLLCRSFAFYVSLSLSLSVKLHIDWALLHSGKFLSVVTELSCALDHSSNAFALAQDCHKKRLAFVMVAERCLSAIASGVTRKLSRSAAAAAVAQQRAGMATTADLMTLQQQIRQEIADSLQRVRE